MQQFVRDAARDGVAAYEVELHRFRRVMALGRSLPGAFLTWTNWWLPRNRTTVTSQSPVTGRLERAHLIPPPLQDTLRPNSGRMPFCAGQPIANYPIQIANFQLPLRPMQTLFVQFAIPILAICNLRAEPAAEPRSSTHRLPCSVLDEIKRSASTHDPLERVFTLLSRERKATMHLSAVTPPRRVRREMRWRARWRPELHREPKPRERNNSPTHPYPAG